MKLNIVRNILLYIADIIKRHYLTGPHGSSRKAVTALKPRRTNWNAWG